jgi:HNH endonuclease
MKQVKSRTCAACRSQSKESNGNWKGGRSKHKAGYVMIRIPHHPRARGNSGYVFEHILVMEEVLGRFLRLEESVHHRNGVRNDNRPENLELWTRPQPSGIRVADAVTWAQEILRRYGNGPTSNNTQETS